MAKSVRTWPEICTWLEIRKPKKDPLNFNQYVIGMDMSNDCLVIVKISFKGIAIIAFELFKRNQQEGNFNHVCHPN